MAIDTALDRLLDCVINAVKVRDDVDSQASQSLDQDNQKRLQWLDKQLEALITQLRGISLDLESGLSLGDLGYLSEDDFSEMLENIECEIRQLHRMIREVKGLGRCF